MRSWIGGAGDEDAGIGELTKEILSRVDETLDEYKRGGRARHVATRKRFESNENDKFRQPR